MSVLRWAALGAAGLAACTAATPPAGGLDALVGTWRSPVWALQPLGTWQRSFAVTPDGRVQQGYVSWGGYLGQPGTAISVRSVLYGRIAVLGDGYVIHPDSEVTEDVFYGPDNHSVQTDFTGWPRDTVRFAVADGVLYRRYLTYPADAPVITRDTLYLWR